MLQLLRCCCPPPLLLLLLQRLLLLVLLLAAAVMMLMVAELTAAVRPSLDLDAELERHDLPCTTLKSSTTRRSLRLRVRL